MRVFRRELGMTPQQYRQKNQVMVLTAPYDQMFAKNNPANDPAD
jgi:AraC-like DNA-binding protein